MSREVLALERAVALAANPLTVVWRLVPAPVMNDWAAWAVAYIDVATADRAAFPVELRYKLA